MPRRRHARRRRAHLAHRHDKPHATGLQIRTHANETLRHITSFGVTIDAVPTAEIVFG